MRLKYYKTQLSYTTYKTLSLGQYGPLKLHQSKPHFELHSLTTKFYFRQATSALNYKCEYIIPLDKGATLFDKVIINNKPKTQNNIRTNALIEAYKNKMITTQEMKHYQVRKKNSY